MRGLVTCHHLSCVGEDGGGEEAEGVDACRTNGRAEGVKGGRSSVETKNMGISQLDLVKWGLNGFRAANCVGVKDQRDPGLQSAF